MKEKVIKYNKVLISVLLLVVLGFTVSVQAKKNPPPPPPAPPAPQPAPAPAPATISLAKKSWATLSDPNPFPLGNDSAGGLYFDFPAAPKSMGYLYNKTPPKTIGGTVVISLGVATTGTPVFKNWEQSDSCAPQAHPFFMSGSDPFNAAKPLARWWANPASYTLASGNTTLSIPLTPENWSSADGRWANADATTLAAFNAAKSNVSGMGVTFGGCFFGHGVSVSGGTARFTINSYKITP